MLSKSLEQEGNQLILHTTGVICSTTRELASSDVFEFVVERYIAQLRRHDSPLLDQLCADSENSVHVPRLIALLRTLAAVPLEQVVKILPHADDYIGRREPLHELVEGLYDFWRSYDRFMVCHSEQGPDSHDQRPYRTFNATVEQLTHLVRALYRDICENITGDHPRVYRQVSAGCNAAVIAVPKPWNCPQAYSSQLSDIEFVRQVLVNPPMVLVSPTSKRTEHFRKIESNPVSGLSLDTKKWLCYPAQVGNLVIFMYFHQKSIGVGCALANLFGLATDEQISTGPDAVYVHGAPGEQRFPSPEEGLAGAGDTPAVFYDDEQNGFFVATVPDEERFGGFNYLREMALTLHNVVNIKRGIMPFHGSMIRVELRNGNAANILMIGDDYAGRRESIEALRLIGSDSIRDFRIIANDMGSLHISEGNTLLGYGAEIGACIRLDDLKYGHALGQMDRAIIMNPGASNARVVIPVTNLDDVTRGYRVDVLVYTNNYEETDSRHTTIEQFTDFEDAFKTFRDAATMVKGTTMSTGVAHTYFANRFGAVQYTDVHDELARRTLRAAIDSGAFVGQVRTRVGIRRYGERGPHLAAQALLDLVGNNRNGGGQE